MMDQIRIVNDLPPRWDGFAVVWRGWTSPLVISCRRLPGDRCVQCGGDKAPSVNVGLAATDETMTHRQVVDHDKAAQLGAGRVQRRAWRSLMAMRCPDCGHDQVRDGEGTWWDLDPSDYTDEGSTSPTLFR